MIDLAQLLELLYSAHARFESARATLRVRVDHSKLEQSDWPEDAPPPARGQPLAYVARVWYESAGRVRLEREFDGERTVKVAHQDTDDEESLALRLARLFDPAPLLGVALFELVGETTRAGRSALSVIARPRRHEIDIGFWGCDAYELAVDAERGVLLGVVGQIGDEIASTIVVEEIAFDDSFDPELFVHEPEEESLKEIPSESWQSQAVSLQTAAERAPFTLWVVRELLDQWRMYVQLVEEEPPGAEPAWVEILYRSPDGAGRVDLTERRASEPEGYGWTSYQTPRLIEHRGEPVVVLAYDPYETNIAVTREGTRVAMTAFDSLERTLQLVDALAPVALTRNT
jgi:hypothetical protein